MQQPPFYLETMTELGAPDPLSGETDADKELAATSARHAENVAALKAVASSDWQKIPATEARPSRSAGTNRRVKTHG